MQNNQLALIAIVAALSVLGVVVVLAVVTIPVQEAEAGCENGNTGTVNNTVIKSRGKCLDRGTF